MKVYVIGNGYSINLVNYLEKHNYIEPGVVDFRNLFAKGDCIPGKNGEDCYLSKINCPLLWKLGIRSIIDSEKASELINNIISSYTLYVKRCKLRAERIDPDHPSAATYFELNRYLKKLILYYDGLIVDAIEKIDQNVLSQIKFPIIDEICSEDVVISYNYDILFERLLAISGKEFLYVMDVHQESKKIRIFKPHGSINFDCTVKADENIYDLNLRRIGVVDFNRGKLPMQFSNSLIIPPSGFIVGKEDSWVAKMRNGICSALNNCCPTHITFFGLSYDLVDRDEINEILCHLDTESTQIIYINPKPAPSFDYILSQNYKKYVHKKP